MLTGPLLMGPQQQVLSDSQGSACHPHYQISEPSSFCTKTELSFNPFFYALLKILFIFIYCKSRVAERESFFFCFTLNAYNSQDRARLQPGA